MKRKGLSLLLILGMVFVFAGVSTADVPPPPVNQNLGFDDTEFNFLTAADCQECHPNTVDGHHLLYGDPLTPGECSLDASPCLTNEDCDTGAPPTVCNITGAPCPVGNCSVTTATSCTIDENCPAGEECIADDCPQSYTGQTCAQPFCYGESAIVDSDANSDGNLDTNLGCLNCHIEDSSTGVIDFIVIRDCLVCHEAGPNQPNVHHSFGGTAQSGFCTPCHGDLVDDPLGCKELCCAASFGPTGGQCVGPCTTDADCGGGETCVALGAEAPCDDGHAIPTYAPSLVTPAPSTRETEHECSDDQSPCDVNADCTQGTCSVTPVACNEGESDCPLGETCIGGAICEDVYVKSPGGCIWCHEPGIDTASGVVVIDNHDTHHHTGVYKTPTGGSQRDKCAWCHKAGNPHNAGGEDPDAIRFCENCHGYEALHNIQDDSPNAANPGTIVVGAEDAYYGHVGRDNPADPDNDSDCWGCHGFATSMAAPAAGAIIPSLTDTSTLTITAGSATEITLTGNAFTNTTGATDYSSVVQVTDNDGAVVATVAPASITVGSLTATLPALDAGILSIQVKKDAVLSNPVVVNCVPAVAIDSADCADGVLTITGSGFGDAAPAGAEEFINVKLGAETAEILSWSDTVITVSGCNDAVTVNALYGSASTGATACSGNFDGDADVDGSDASAFKADFGRNTIINPCAAGSLCNGDFDCDGDVDGSDASAMKADFGRSAFNNACAEEVAADCSY